MKKLLITLPDNLSTALVYTLLHALWQGVIVLIVFMAINQFLRSSKSKYTWGMIALFTQLLVSVITFTTVFQPVVNTNSFYTEVSASENLIWETLNAAPETTLAGIQGLVSQHHSKLTLLWLVGVAFLLIRMAVGFFYVEKLKTTKIKNVSQDIKQKMATLQQKIGVSQSVALFESLSVNGPLTVGWLKPVILFPASMLANLPANQIEAILAHELAHIQRKDYLFNILQNVVETIFFFHPAVWILSTKIREERENCCDDVAMEVCQNKFVLANALAEVASFQSQARLSMAFGGHKNSVLGRIKRIAGISEKQYLSTGHWLTLTLFLCLGTAGWSYANEKTEDFEEILTTETEAKIEETLEKVSHLMEAKKDTFPRTDTEIRMEKLSKEMNSLSAQMTKYSEAMQDFSKEMNSTEMQALSNEMQKLSEKMQKPSSEIGKLSQEVSLLSLDVSRKRILKEDASNLEKQLDKAQANLSKKQDEMNKISEEMNKVGEKMNLLHKPMEEIHKKMDKQRIPMDSIAAIMNKKGEEMNKLGDQLRKENEEMTSAFGPLLKKEGFTNNSDSYDITIKGETVSLNGKSLSGSEAQKLKALISNHFRKAEIELYDEVRIKKNSDKPSYIFKKGNISHSSNWSY